VSWDWQWERFLVALIVGAQLSLGGSLVQLTTRNDLASPSTLGMDGLAIGVLLVCFVLGVTAPEALTAVVLTTALILWPWIAHSKMVTQRRHDFRLLLLLGLAINLLVGAMFSMMHFMAMAFNKEFPSQLWFGRISVLSTWQWVGALAVLGLSLSLLTLRRRSWKAMLLGVGWCHGLKIPVERITREAMALAFVGNFWVITQFGAFSLLGLLFPLLLRQLARYCGEPFREMTEGALVSAVIFALIDHACYNVTFQGAEIPVALPLSLLGSICLVTLLWRRERVTVTWQRR
jgi:iron complex transport system permease protein